MKEDFKFWRLKEKNCVVYLTFEGWKGVNVFYSTRIGGVSSPPYDTLNLHYGRGDDISNVKLNRKRFFNAVSINERNIVYTKQTHSDIVNIVNDSSEKLKGDGMITDRKSIVLGVFTADCIAVFFHSPINKIISIVHSGRAGAEKGIAKKGVDKMCEAFDIKAESIEALLGPSLGPCCYEVGKEFLKRFKREYLIERKKSIYLDMWKMVREQLEESGVKKILVPEICSCSLDNLFFSYRKSGEKTGENLGIIGMIDDRRQMTENRQEVISSRALEKGRVGKRENRVRSEQ